MLRMIVIADDITGAAEIAGIAYEAGRKTTVIATDTRSMTAAEAVAETRRVAELHKKTRSFRVVFKKTDSALRGHVVAELTALMEVMGYQRAVYLPANPSKGRIIRNGTYYILKELVGESQLMAVPIHETDFRFDPEFPARTSVMKERFPDAEAHNILMPDAETMDDIRSIVAQYNDGQTLFAGAADLFTALLEREGSPNPKSFITSHSSFLIDNTLILRGSTQSKTLDLGIPVAPMPREVYDGSDDLTLWDTTAYTEKHSLVLSIPYTHRTGKEVAVHLRSMMSEMTRRLVSEHCPEHLIIEGGATAWATLRTLGWTRFRIVRQIAPGVVQMSATNGTLVTLKPGSYPWGSLFEGCQIVQ